MEIHIPNNGLQLEAPIKMSFRISYHTRLFLFVIGSISAFIVLYGGLFGLREKILLMVPYFGAFLNFLVVTANGKKMPVIGPTKETTIHKKMGKKDRLKFLADIFTLIIPLRKKSYIVYNFSIGDSLIYLGIILNITLVLMKW